MKTGVFQMFDDSPPVLPGSTTKNGYHVPHYPTKQIKTPIAIFYGGKDTLPDMPYILDNIREPVYCLNVEGNYQVPLLFLAVSTLFIFLKLKTLSFSRV